ncbi:bestrophin family protein [Planctopirus hydrillae]|uniref:Bestrophin n=1 Tax=Planctopirus hydrillae TaxID=1841610 RepID=A0A1C3ELW9_9PLAN|nr:bestrophin family ion channel [Planctopirus hydrillae]ODA34226.1 hypothetical protein A6X21_17835 [Planctopirus hydrillae]
MIEYNRYSWWKTAFSFRGTALPRAGWRVFTCVIYALLVQATFELGSDLQLFDEQRFLGIDPVGHAVVGSLLGFLIVFRMNSSNNRYWEGRSHWGQLINSSRNLVRFGCEYGERGSTLSRLVAGYVISLRRSLHGQRDTEEVDVYLPAELCEQVSRFGNIPTGVTSAISHWIGEQYRKGKLDSMQVRQMEDQLSKMVDAQGGCEKIQKTPLPFIYVAMIKQLILAYLITLPLVLCERCGWWSPVLMFVVSLALLGMEEASVEIEDPFGSDGNCLDLEALTLTIARDAGQLALFKPVFICDDQHD